MYKIICLSKIDKKEWYKVRTIAYQTYISNWQHPKKKPVSIDSFMNLEGNANKSKVSDEQREAFIKAVKLYKDKKRMEQLKVGIGADTKGLDKGLKDAEKALSAFATKSKQIETQLRKNAIESSKLGAEISKLTQDFNKGAISESNYGKKLLNLLGRKRFIEPI